MAVWAPKTHIQKKWSNIQKTNPLFFAKKRTINPKELRMPPTPQLRFPAVLRKPSAVAVCTCGFPFLSERPGNLHASDALKVRRGERRAGNAEKLHEKNRIVSPPLFAFFFICRREKKGPPDVFLALSRKTRKNIQRTIKPLRLSSLGSQYREICPAIPRRGSRFRRLRKPVHKSGSTTDSWLRRGRSESFLSFAESAKY